MKTRDLLAIAWDAPMRTVERMADEMMSCHRREFDEAETLDEKLAVMRSHADNCNALGDYCKEQAESFRQGAQNMGLWRLWP